ncbi:hypothetical protein TNCV_584791 [Trichonephila clavipes]|nr:hypothetical protein TNCV_584791 [Trichonephila clavipes]
MGEVLPTITRDYPTAKLLLALIKIRLLLCECGIDGSRTKRREGSKWHRHINTREDKHLTRMFDIHRSAGLSIGRLGRAPRGPNKLDLTRFTGNEFRSASAKGPLHLLHPGPEMSLNRH